MELISLVLSIRFQGKHSPKKLIFFRKVLNQVEVEGEGPLSPILLPDFNTPTFKNSQKLTKKPRLF